MNIKLSITVLQYERENDIFFQKGKGDLILHIRIEKLYLRFSKGNSPVSADIFGVE